MADSRRVSTICRAKKVDRKRRARAQMSPSRSLTKLCNAAYSLNQYGPSAAQYIEVQPGGASMNNRAEIMPKAETLPVTKATLKQRLFTIGFFAAVAVATIGWVSALGWVAVAVANWLLA